MPKKKRLARVFLNLPYDSKYENLFLAYLCAVHAFGMDPQVTLDIPGGERHLDRIFGLMQSCEYAVHDLSRLKPDGDRPKTY